MLKQLLVLATFSTAWLGSVIPPSSANSPCLVGNKLEVRWRGQWYRATALNANGAKCYVTYDGYDRSWDEWVGPDRMRGSQVYYRVGSAVQVLWRGQWYGARVVNVSNGQYFITYDGYDRSWDEWVGPGRIRGY